MDLRQCFLTKNDCYRSGRTIKPKGVMVHSTGANNPYIKRYVQPDDGLLGVNQNGNHWNQPGIQKCVHAFVGKLEDGSIATYQTLPWTMRGWHAGGNANNTHIGFEICEDDLRGEVYFKAVYREAVELTAYLCKAFGLDPLRDGVVICHKEGWRRRLASNHGDVEHWFPRHGKTMDDFRRDVANEMEDNEMDIDKLIGEMTDKQAVALFDRVNQAMSREQLPTNWDAKGALQKAVDAGITDGSNPMGVPLRYQVAIMAERAGRSTK